MRLLCIILNLLPQSLSIFFFLIPNSSRQFRDSFEIRKFYTNYSITHNTQLFHVNQTTSLRIRTRKMIQVFIKFESTQFWWFMFKTLAAIYLDDTQYTRCVLVSWWEYIKQTHKTRVMVFTSNSHKMSHKELLLEFGFDFTVFPWNSKPTLQLPSIRSSSVRVLTHSTFTVFTSVCLESLSCLISSDG